MFLEESYSAEKLRVYLCFLVTPISVVTLYKCINSIHISISSNEIYCFNPWCFVSIVIHYLLHDQLATISNEETFLQDFLVSRSRVHCIQSFSYADKELPEQISL